MAVSKREARATRVPPTGSCEVPNGAQLVLPLTNPVRSSPRRAAAPGAVAVSPAALRNLRIGGVRARVQHNRRGCLTLHPLTADSDCSCPASSPEAGLVAARTLGCGLTHSWRIRAWQWCDRWPPKGDALAGSSGRSATPLSNHFLPQIASSQSYRPAVNKHVMERCMHAVEPADVSRFDGPPTTGLGPALVVGLQRRLKVRPYLQCRLTVRPYLHSALC